MQGDAPAGEQTTTTTKLDDDAAAAAPTSAPSSALPSTETAALSAAERLSLIALWDAEAARLAAAFSARPPLTPWPAPGAPPPPPRPASKGAPTPLELAPFLLDRGDPLSELSARVCAALGGESSSSEAGKEGGGGASTADAAFAVPLLSVDVVKSEILALAKRTLVGCSSLPDAEAASKQSGGNALEDASPGRIWHWELREPRRAPKQLRAACAASKSAASRVAARLGCRGTSRRRRPTAGR